MRTDNKYCPHLYDNVSRVIVMQTITPFEAFSMFGIVETFKASPYGAFVVTMHARWKGSVKPDDPTSVVSYAIVYLPLPIPLFVATVQA